MIKIENTEVYGFEAAIQIPEFPEYKITKNGDVIGKRGNVMTGHVDRHGYKEVLFSYYSKSKNMLVHRLVLSTFKPVPNMDKLQVNHKDGNKLNNSLDNLEWCTRSENINHSYRNGLQKVVTNPYGTFNVLSKEQTEKIYQLHKEGLIDKEIAKIIGCSRELVGRKIRKAGLR